MTNWKIVGSDENAKKKDLGGEGGTEVPNEGGLQVPLGEIEPPLKVRVSSQRSCQPRRLVQWLVRYMLEGPSPFGCRSVSEQKVKTNALWATGDPLPEEG